MISHEDAMNLWYRAAQAKIGLEIPTNDHNYLMQTLYTARVSSGDKDLDRLSLVKTKVGICIMDRERAKDVIRDATQGDPESL
jgi:hypothetical protein